MIMFMQFISSPDQGSAREELTLCVCMCVCLCVCTGKRVCVCFLLKWTVMLPSSNQLLVMHWNKTQILKNKWPHTLASRRLHFASNLLCTLNIVFAFVNKYADLDKPLSLPIIWFYWVYMDVHGVIKACSSYRTVCWFHIDRKIT